MKKFLLCVVSIVMAISLAACDKGGNGSSSTGGGTVTDLERFNNLAADTTATLDIMVWSGDGQYHEDLGHKDLKPSELKGQNVAAIYAVAKEFNKIFPNIKINLFAKLDDPNGGGVSWEQEIENFKNDHGKYPDIWASNNVTRDISKGLVLDLSEFSENAYYKEMNESLLNMTNYYGFQAALPQYILPWGIYVNRELAEENNISAPSVNWNWTQYTNFVSKAKPANDFYGSWDAGMRLIRWATVEKQLQNNTVENAYIDITTTEFSNAVKQLPKQATTAVQSLFGLGELTADDMVNIGNYWGYKAFADGKLLTYDGDPWMLGFSNIEGDGNYVLSGDWDIYPCPAVNTNDNYVSAVLDPLCVYNYYEKTGEVSENARKKALIAYAFSAFWTADTRSWEARANQQYCSSTTASGEAILASALNDSFPIVTGEEFTKQMDLWYSTPGHAAYQNTTKFPGFAEVCRLWNDGKIYSVSDKAYPLSYTDSDGTAIDCLAYLTQFGNPDYVGNVTISDTTWANTYIAGIPEWNTRMNGYFTNAFALLETSLKNYYGFNDSDFN